MYIVKILPIEKRLTYKKTTYNLKLKFIVIKQAYCFVWKLFNKYMHQSTRLPLAQVMTCHLFGAKPLSTSMLACQSDYWEIIQWNLNQNAAIFIMENAFENKCLQNFV